MPGLVNCLLTPAARNNPVLRRAQLELVLSLAVPFLFMPVVALSILYLKDAVDLYDMGWFAAWFLLPLGQWLILRLTGAVNVVRDISTVLILVFVGFGALHTGGIKSSLVIGLCIVPLENMLTGDRRRVIMSIVAVFLCLGILWGAGELHLLPADRISSDLRDKLRPLAVIFVMLYSFLVADALIRHRRAGEKALADTENLFESLFETAPISIMEQDWSQIRLMINALADDGMADLNHYLLDYPDVLKKMIGAIRFTRVNKATLMLYRANGPDELIEHLAPERLTVEELRNYRLWICSFATAGTGNYLNETINRRRRGGQVYTRVRSSIVPEHRHDWLRVITTVGDVSDRKRTELDLHTAKEEADRANRAKSRFLASMSHELRTPLNAIIGFSDIMRQQMFGPIGGGRYLSYAEDIHDSGQHLLNLINDMLDLSRIESGKYEMREEWLGAQDLFDWVLNMTEPQILARGVEVSHDVEDGMPNFWADQRAMRQILLNLLSNALKFTPPGKSIRLSAIQDARNGNIVLEVADRGQGIPARLMNTITEPFVQAGDPAMRTEQGTGLGLSITKSLVEMHGGNLALASTEHVGTTVTVTFPASRAEMNGRTDSLPDVLVASGASPTL
ncbi:MAG: ATP-binding protein [Alphaproteobacteria bacterium]